MTGKRTGRRKGRLVLIILCAFSLGCYLFRHDLLVIGFDIYLKRQVAKNFSRPISYEKMIWKEDRIVTSGINISDEQFHLTIDQLEVDLFFNISQWKMECKVHCIHPELTLVRRSDSIFLPFTASSLRPQKFWEIVLEIDNGVLQLNTLEVEERLYFSFVSGKESSEIGTFFLSYDPHLFALPTTEVNISIEKEEIVAGLKIGQMESRRLLQLMSFFFPLLRQGWENAQGQVEVMASATFSKDFSLSRLAGLIDAREVYLSNSLLGIQMQAKGLHGEVAFPPQEGTLSGLPFWKQIKAYATVEEGQWMLGDDGVSAINAHLLLDPALDPLLDLSGVWIHEGKEVSLTAQGKGSVLEDQNFWLELGIKFYAASTEELKNDQPHIVSASEFLSNEEKQTSNALVSICSTEKQSYVVQVEFNHLDVALLEMFGSPLPITRGTVEGKLTGWIYDKQLAKLQIDDLRAEEIAWSIPQMNIIGYAASVHGESLFSKDHKNNWHVVGLLGEMQEVCFVKEQNGRRFRSPAFTVEFSGEGQVVASEILSKEDEKLEVHFDFHRKEGWLRSDSLTQSFYGSWIQQLYPQMGAEGECEVFGTFNSEKIFLSVQGRNLILDHPHFTCYIPEMPHPALLTYSIFQKEWEGAWTIEKGTYIEKNSQLYCTDITASCELDDSKLVCKELIASCEEVKFSGFAVIDFKEDNFQLMSTSLEGTLAFLGKLIPNQPCFQGNFITEAGGLVIEGQKGKIDWSLKAKLKNIDIPLQNGIDLQEGQCELIYDSKIDLLLIHEIESKIFYKSKPYKLHAQLKKKEWWEFDVTVLNKQKEVARVVGIAQEKPPAEVHFAFEKNKTHFFGSKLSINRFILKDWTELLALDMDPVFSADEICEQLAFLQEAGIVHLELPSFFAEGEIHANITFENNLHFHAEARSLIVNGKDCGEFSLKGCKVEDTWILEHLKTAHFFANGKFFQENAFDLFLQGPTYSVLLDGIYDKAQGFSGNVRSLNLELAKTGMIAARGAYAFETAAREIIADVEVVAENGLFAAATQKSLQVRYSLSTGLVLEDVSFAIRSKKHGAEVAIAQAPFVLFDGKKWECRKGGIELSKEFLFAESPEYIDWIPTSFVVKAEYFPEENLLKIGSKTKEKEHPFYTQLQIDHSEELLLGMLKISDDPKTPGIKCLFKETLGCTSIQGEIAGISIYLTQTAPQTFWGTITLDPSILQRHLPYDKQVIFEKLGMEGKYQLEGNWDLDVFNFKGALKAQNFTLFNMHFETLQAGLSFCRNECACENLTLEDPAGKLFMKQIHFTRTNAWECYAPLALIQDFHPGLLLTKTVKDQPMKPFTIKKLSLYNIEGIAGDKTSFSAQGKLNFVNALKKEFSFLDIPLDALKNLGLDLGLLTPVYGEAEFKLSRGKFLLTELKNTYSEGKRSEFYLHGEEPSYLDLEGNIRLDLKMKQHVVLNITEPFTLSVRGTLVQPEYSLVR